MFRHHKNIWTKFKVNYSYNDFSYIVLTRRESIVGISNFLNYFFLNEIDFIVFRVIYSLLNHIQTLLVLFPFTYENVSSHG